MENTDQDEHYTHCDGQEVCQHETIHPEDRILFFGEGKCPLCHAITTREMEINELKSNCRQVYRDYMSLERPQITAKYRQFVKGG